MKDHYHAQYHRNLCRTILLFSYPSRFMDYRRIKNLSVIFLIVLTFGVVSVFAGDSLPKPEKMGLPFENTSDATMPIVKIIKESIKYVGILAMLALSW